MLLQANQEDEYQFSDDTYLGRIARGLDGGDVAPVTGRGPGDDDDDDFGEYFDEDDDDDYEDEDDYES